VDAIVSTDAHETPARDVDLKPPVERVALEGQRPTLISCLDVHPAFYDDRSRGHFVSTDQHWAFGL
jgi:hypothetical protein